MAACNKYGVYEPDETLSLPRKGRGGVSVATIQLADLGPHWIWATSFQMSGGDYWGKFSPLKDQPNHREQSRVVAIKAAAADLRRNLSSRADPDAKSIMAWLETLIPDQFDMFGVAA